MGKFPVYSFQKLCRNFICGHILSVPWVKTKEVVVSHHSVKAILIGGWSNETDLEIRLEELRVVKGSHVCF